MTNTQSHAQRELEILAQTVPDALILEFKDELLALCEKFGQSGQSGGSAPYVASALSSAVRKLCLFETIAPLTGEDDEWGRVEADESMKYQNLRDSRVFKDSQGRAYFIEAMIKECPDGSRWHGGFWRTEEDYLTGNKELMIRPSGWIKSFPFTPKTFYLNVIEKEVAKDDWEMWLADPKQLEEVAEYYDLK